MKTLAAIFSCLLLNSCIAKDGKLQEIPYLKTFYWTKSTTNEFHALVFRRDTATFCEIYSFGRNEENRKVRYELVASNQKMMLKESLSGLKKGTIVFQSDSVCLLTLYGKKDKVLTMEPNPSFEQLFGKVKAKYLFECTASSQILYNGIECFKTEVEKFQNDPSYILMVDTYSDEIYGSGELRYLLYEGNKFFYTTFNDRTVFNKVEVNSKIIQNAFLGISIGDTKEQVQNKLMNYKDRIHIKDLSIVLKICNTQIPGSFGKLWFFFKKQSPGQHVILHQILYDALIEE